MNSKSLIHLRVNGEAHALWVEPRQHLVDCLRDEIGLKGTRVGCEHGVCGACTVLLDGDIVRGCLVLAVQADGHEVQTIEGVADAGAIPDLQQAFIGCNAAQCGACTPGMLLTAHALLRYQPGIGREQIREQISGNYCRCTGYQAIVDAIEQARDSRQPSNASPAAAIRRSLHE
jgi:carbon-monoxide dehydrogenase small subunit